MKYDLEIRLQAWMKLMIKHDDLYRFSQDIGIPPEKLVEAFEIERTFHENIFAEKSFETRQQLYEEVYNTVHLIYGRKITDIFTANPKDQVVRLFIKELKDKSILDIGCGDGCFLARIS